MKTKGKRPEVIVFTNADPRYAGKLDDPQGGDATMLMQQVRQVMTVSGLEGASHCIRRFIRAGPFLLDAFPR